MLNKKSFAYQAGILALSNSALLLLSFAYRILLGRLAGPEGMGVYTLVIQVYSILMSVCVYGLCVAVTHMAASLGEDYKGLRKLTGYALTCFFLLFALLALPVFLLRNTIAQGILGDTRTVAALLMILACVLLTGVENIIKALFTGMRLVKYTAVSEVGEQIFRIIFAGLLLTRFMDGDHGRTAFLILCAMTLSELYSVVFLGVTHLRRVLFHRVKEGREHPAIFRRFIQLALPSMFTSVLGNVFASVSVILFPIRLMLAGYLRSEAISALGLISGMIMPILLLPSAFINAVCTLLMPSIADCAAHNKKEQLEVKINKGIETIGLIGVPAMAVLMPFTSLLCTLLFGQTAPYPLVVLLCCETVICFYLGAVNSILNGLGKQKQVLMLTGIREIIQLSLVWVLTAMPTLHVYGYVIGLIMGDLAHVAIGFIMIRRAAGLRPRLLHAGLAPVACAVSLFLCARLIFFAVLAWGGTVLAALLIGLAACIILYFVLLRLLGIRAISYLKRSVASPKAT